jgi:hypothetical protein
MGASAEVIQFAICDSTISDIVKPFLCCHALIMGQPGISRETSFDDITARIATSCKQALHRSDYGRLHHESQTAAFTCAGEVLSFTRFLMFGM